jgi:large subunit ribosomal protein L32
MAVPKRKTSPGKRNQRRSHHALKIASHIRENETTGELVRNHHVSRDGYYKGRQVTKVKVNA